MRTLSLAPISGRRRPAVSQVLRWAGPSVLAHVALVAMSAVQFGTTERAEKPLHEVIFLAPLLPRQDAQEPLDASTGPGGAPVGWRDLTSVASGDGVGAGTSVGESTGRGQGSSPGPLVTADTTTAPEAGDENVYQAVDVDREVSREPDGAAPIYPETLRLGGVQGAVTVEFVVDTLGRVEAGSLHVIGTTHPQFASAVRTAAPGMRFRPAVRAGQLVRQQVIQSFQFVLQTAVQAAAGAPAPRDSTPRIRPDGH